MLGWWGADKLLAVAHLPTAEKILGSTLGGWGALHSAHPPPFTLSTYLSSPYPQSPPQPD